MFLEPGAAPDRFNVVASDAPGPKRSAVARVPRALAPGPGTSVVPATAAAMLPSGFVTPVLLNCQSMTVFAMTFLPYFGSDRRTPGVSG